MRVRTLRGDHGEGAGVCVGPEQRVRAGGAWEVRRPEQSLPRCRKFFLEFNRSRLESVAPQVQVATGGMRGAAHADFDGVRRGLRGGGQQLRSMWSAF